MISGAFYALLAGFLGAVASSSAKLSLGSDYLKGMCETGLKTWSQDGDYRIIPEETSPCEWVRVYLYECIIFEVCVCVRGRLRERMCVCV